MSDLAFLIITLIISTVGITVSLILYFGQTVPSLSSKLLSCLILSLSCSAIGLVMPLTSVYTLYPNSYKIFAWSPFCIAPFAYLYVKTVLHQSIRLKRKYFFLFLPLVLYMLNRLPFYLLSQQEKEVFIQNIYQNYSLYFLEPEGLLPTGWAPAIRFVFLITMTSFTFYELFYRRRKIFDMLFQIGKNKEIYRFQLVVTSILFFGIIASVVGVILQLKMHIDGNRMIVVSIWIELIIICLYLFTQPKILYGITGWVQEQVPVKSIDEAIHLNTVGVEVGEQDDENIDYVTIHRGRNILKTIDEHFRLNHPYTKIGYTITDLSKEINIPAYLISVVINQEFGNNFNEFVNDARISYLKTWKESDSNFDNYSIEYIGNAVGFASRTSFIAAVKKRTGLLPKDYLIQL